jgi:hypothetical protein
MKTKSRKAKGRQLQNIVRKALQSRFKGLLELGDIRVSIMGESGSDLKLSPLARKFIPYYPIECKNQEKMQIWKWWRQVEAMKKEGERPLLVVKRNHSPILAICLFDDLLDII